MSEPTSAEIYDSAARYMLKQVRERVDCRLALMGLSGDKRSRVATIGTAGAYWNVLNDLDDLEKGLGK